MITYIIQGFIGQIIYDKALARNNLSVMFQHRVPIIPPMPGTKTKELLEAPSVRMVGILHHYAIFQIER